MSANLKDIIKEEYIKCFKDPAYFIKKYCMIQHPNRGRMNFNLFIFQEKILKIWVENPNSVVLKSRQLGVSTLVAGYSLWLMLFNKDKNVLCIATKTDTAKNMVTKVKFMYNNLPSWLRTEAEEDNKLSLRLKNGSQIKAVSAASDSGRSEAVSLLIIDEAAFIEGIEELWASAQQTLGTGGSAIIISTPNGTGNWFHKMWVKAEEKENNFIPIKLPWFVHPERNEAWRKKQDEDLGDPRLAAQECDCTFSVSGDTVFHNEIIAYYESMVLKPLETRGQDNNLWIWEYVDYSRNYMVTADVARGDGKDYSTFHVFDIETNAQVAEYKGQLAPKEFALLLISISTEYNNALLVIENSNIGWSTVESVLERGYKNLYFSSKSDNFNLESYSSGYYQEESNLTPGFSMSLKTRPLAINKLREYIGDRSVSIKSQRLIEEMKVFIWKNGRAEARVGYNDDLIMAFALGMYLRDTSLKYKSQNQDLARAALSNMSVNRQSFPTMHNTVNSNKVINPYQLEINGRKENLTWLL